MDRNPENYVFERNGRWCISVVSRHFRGGRLERVYRTREQALEMAGLVLDELRARNFRLDGESRALAYPENLIRAIMPDYEKGGYDMLYIEQNFADNYERASQFLTDRERLILDERFRKCSTLKEVGTLCGITKEAVRRAENTALAKLSRPESLVILTSREEAVRREISRIRAKVMAEVREEMAREVARVVDDYLRERYGTGRNDGFLDESITVLRLPGKAQGALLRADIVTVGELVGRTPEELMAVRGFGRGALNATMNALHRRGYRLNG